MKNYLFYTNEIDGLTAVEETVRVVEKSAASHIHFLKKKVMALAVYKNQIEATLNRLSHFYWDTSHPLLKEGGSDSKVLLAITGTKGIVGGLYHEIVNQVIAQRNDYSYIWVIGKKGAEYLEEEGIAAESLFSEDAPEEELSAIEIKKISSILFDRFQNSELQKIDILYSRFTSLAIQQPAIKQFLPFSLAGGQPFDLTQSGLSQIGENDPVSAKASADARVLADGPADKQDGLPIFEPSKKFIFDILIKKYIDVSLVQIILEEKLSEFAARTVTAESAIKETETIIDSLRRAFLKDKHRAITQQQLEIFSAH